MSEKKNLFGVKIEKGIRYNSETDSYFVQFNFKDVSRLNCFPTLEDARKYRDAINAEKLAYKIARDTKIIKEQEDAEIKKYLHEKPEFPFNALAAIKVEKIKNLIFDEEMLVEFDQILEERCTEREKVAIIKYYKDNYTLEKIGRQLGVTRERTRQLICSGLRKIANYYINYNAIKSSRLVREAIEKDLADRHAMREKLIEEYRKTGVITDDIEYEFGTLYNKNTGKLLDIVGCNIEELDLSVRSYNCLKRAKIETINQLIKLTEKDLCKIKNLGRRCIKEIKDKLALLGLTIATSSEGE